MTGEIAYADLCEKLSSVKFVPAGIEYLTHTTARVTIYYTTNAVCAKFIERTTGVRSRLGPEGRVFEVTWHKAYKVVGAILAYDVGIAVTEGDPDDA